ncbi:PTB domain-containing engulfment adapter protein 1 isoform X1 [Patella vulgata]|uniref:PTB domain-containing engulfment adapter protein 1 isoform X1 n=1 Tax=Patella vulgata TaxID=6465 RepID=UPI00217F5D0A|nr:PTB domain-containing engulfment adapter protein 1 isoform X1 [Patella vulgata]XP_050404753.1 PTB domain-containing engulfment adapter protein 1 isoform X1 [Patella vulgata]
MQSGNKQWVHPSEALIRGHVLYNVKFLGECSVDQPKGSEVVKDAIRKMKFNKHIKRAEGQKPQKVELTISVDGVTIQDRVSKMIMHQYPLHRISYCADDKSDKRMFTFIAKSANTSQHNCYVFESEKCSEEITLTVGQAFDLAYRRFLDSSGKDMDMKKQFLLLQKKVQTLQTENDSLKKRIAELEKLKEVSNSDVNDSQKSKSTVGRRLENLLLDTTTVLPVSQTNGANNYDNTTPTIDSVPVTPVLSPPPPSGRSRTLIDSPSTPTQIQSNKTANPFNSSGFGYPGQDPFGMGAFNPSSTGSIDQAIKNVDQELFDIQFLLKMAGLESVCGINYCRLVEDISYIIPIHWSRPSQAYD